MSGRKKPKEINIELLDKDPFVFSQMAFEGAHERTPAEHYERAKNERLQKITMFEHDAQACENAYYAMRDGKPDGAVLTELEAVLLEMELLKWTSACERLIAAMKESALHRKIGKSIIDGADGGRAKVAASPMLLFTMRNCPSRGVNFG